MSGGPSRIDSGGGTHQPPPQQPDIKGTGAESRFSLESSGYTTPSKDLRDAMKAYVQSGSLSDKPLTLSDKTGYFKFTTINDPNRAGAKIVTVERYTEDPSKGGKPAESHEYSVQQSRDGLYDKYTVYEKDSKMVDMGLTSRRRARISGKLKALLGTTEGKKWWKAFVFGWAMDMMKAIRKHGKFKHE